jgi:hypothetical protein
MKKMSICSNQHKKSQSLLPKSSLSATQPLFNPSAITLYFQFRWLAKLSSIKWQALGRERTPFKLVLTRNRQ